MYMFEIAKFIFRKKSLGIIKINVSSSIDVNIRISIVQLQYSEEKER